MQAAPSESLPTLRAVLFDLDDTLLENDMAVFGSAYLQLIALRCAPVAPSEAIVVALQASIAALLRHDDPVVSNEAYFWQIFPHHLNVPEPALRAAVDLFCREDVPTLQKLTRRRPEAYRVVRQARACGWKVVLATNPMFPLSVTLQRMAWAGLAAADFDLVTTPENSHACKPNPAYFRSILETARVTPQEALIVGDDWALDMVPALQLGMRTFWVRNREAELPAHDPFPTAMGAWPEFLAWWQRLTACMLTFTEGHS